MINNRINRHANTPSKVHCIHPCGNWFAPFGKYCPCKYCGTCGPCKHIEKFSVVHLNMVSELLSKIIWGSITPLSWKEDLTIPCCIIGGTCNLLHKASTNILDFVLEFNALCYSNTIFCHFWGTPTLFDYHITSLK